jgi:hypothetical protein
LPVQLRSATFLTLFVLGCAMAGLAQNAPQSQTAAPKPTETLFFARTGESLAAPHVATIHYLEFLQIRGKWIYPDIGYIDFGHGNYHEFYIGGGRTLFDNKYASFDQELLYVGTWGPAAASAKYLQPWSMLRVRFTPKFTNETVYFLYLPINDAGRFHHVLERAKFEYAVKRRWKIGAGYAGVQLPGATWINKPLLTTTISTKAGALEFWLQRIPSGAQVEVRYALIRPSR